MHEKIFVAQVLPGIPHWEESRSNQLHQYRSGDVGVGGAVGGCNLFIPARRKTDWINITIRYYSIFIPYIYMIWGLVHLPTFTIENLLNLNLCTDMFPPMDPVGTVWRFYAPWLSWRNLLSWKMMWRSKFKDRPKNPTPEPFQTWCAACASIYIYNYIYIWVD